MINRRNYELYFLDYLENRLSAEEREAVELFLNLHPDLREELEGLAEEFPALEAENALYPLNLKKAITEVEGITEENAGDWFIADYEGDLSPADQQVLHRFLKKNPALHADYKAIGKIRISSDPVLFPDKKALKRRVILPIYYYAAAASVLLFIASAYFFNPYKNHFSSYSVQTAEVKVSVFPEYPSVQVRTESPSEVVSTTPDSRATLNEVLVSVESDYSGVQLLTSPLFVSDLSPAEDLYIHSVTPDEEDSYLNMSQMAGYIMERRIGETALTRTLRNRKQLKGGDITELALMPLTALPQSTVTTEKNRIKVNLGFIEADFALAR